MNGQEFPERFLPPDLLARASLRGNEHAWSLDDIPQVIVAARDLGMVNVGGQLQFRLSDGGTCECYWIDVASEYDPNAPWPDQVVQSAHSAEVLFHELPTRFNFLDEGRRAFAPLVEAESTGESLESIMCFVWYVMDQKAAMNLPSIRR